MLSFITPSCIYARDWHSNDDDSGIIKIVMTGGVTDPQEWQAHVRTKLRREELAKRFKVPEDPFKIVIVRDMWLTGFDAPCLHTMYVDKPMRGHGLMQAIARVNRVYKDKSGGSSRRLSGFGSRTQSCPGYLYRKWRKGTDRD